MQGDDGKPREIKRWDVVLGVCLCAFGQRSHHRAMVVAAVVNRRGESETEAGGR